MTETGTRTCGSLQLHPSTEVLDSSKITTYMDCPRRFFYEHVLGWREDKFGVNFHLDFGEAWHRAVEVLSVEGFDDESIVKAFNVFQEYYSSIYDPDAEMHKKKTLANVMKGLVLYCAAYKHSGFTTLFTEVSGVVPIDDHRVIHFRLDNISEQENGQKVVIDHKTASNAGRAWMDQWATSFQMSCYTHAAYCHFPPDEVWGVRIRGMVFSKQTVDERDIVEVPVHKTPRMMQAWLTDAVRWFDLIESDFDRLSSCDDSSDVMDAFPMNSQSCTKYFGCPFIAFCTAWANPLQRCAAAPPEFKVDFWDPRDRDKDATVRVKGGEWVPVGKEPENASGQ